MGNRIVHKYKSRNREIDRQWKKRVKICHATFEITLSYYSIYYIIVFLFFIKYTKIFHLLKEGKIQYLMIYFFIILFTFIKFMLLGLITRESILIYAIKKTLN